jgi:hypothetical protein
MPNFDATIHDGVLADRTTFEFEELMLSQRWEWMPVSPCN